jgi:wyosine [tRNA(Phe)-imidazoG37] synthetase (radical SAM superfamily)
MTPTKTYKYLYGPVPSRRLGLSLGVDIVPLKLCTYDCVYCQLGRTTTKTVERGPYVPARAVLAELEEKLTQRSRIDFVTLGGSGEPTLNSQLGEVIEGAKRITNVPVALLTNGALFFREDIRADCRRADVVLPSLDAGDEQTFRKINRPHPDLSIKKVIDGLSAFRAEFAGRIWLEVFLVQGLNTEPEQIAKIKDAIEHIRPDKIQLNTAVRPTAEPDLQRTESDKLHTIAAILGPGAEVIAEPSLSHLEKHTVSKAQDVLSMLKRRPCSLDDICQGLGIARSEALKYVDLLQRQGLIQTDQTERATYFKGF